MADAEKVAAVRAALPSLAAGIQLDSATAGPLPAEVAAAMDQLQGYERDIGRADAGHREEQLQRNEEARAAIAAVLGGGLGAVTLTHGATEGLTLAAEAIPLRTRDIATGPLRAITTSDASGAIRRALDSWSARLAAAGRPTEVLELEWDRDDARLLDRLDGALDERAVLVAVAHVSPTTGRVLPLRAISELAEARGAAVIADGSQAAGAIPLLVEDLAVDAYAVDGHRWLLGPEGVGGLWQRERPPATAAIDRLHPPSVVGLARAIGWLSMFVGLEFVHRRGTAMAATLAERLASIDGVELITPIASMATIVTFRIAGWEPEAALDELAHRMFLIGRGVRTSGVRPGPDAVRLSPGCWTTSDEIERVAESVRLLAGHTPESLPPRRTLAMLGAP